MSSVRKMRPGLWTGFYLEEKRACTLENLVENICRLRVSGFECAELDERNAYALFVACDKDTARENVRLLQRCVNKASEYGIRVALENQIYPVDMDYYLSEIPELPDSRCFLLCILAFLPLNDRPSFCHVPSPRRPPAHNLPGPDTIS